MHIEINDNTSLREIQEVFTNFYPYLKIEFYGKGHKKYENSRGKNYIDPNRQMGDIRKTHSSGILEILPLSKVANVESEFQHRFGISVQILRKEKADWQKITGMDDFTLKELNEMGRSSSDEFTVEDYLESFQEPDEKAEKLF